MPEPPPPPADSVSSWAGSITRLIRDLGVSTVILGVMGFGVWQALSWVGATVVAPVVERHLRYLDKHENQLDTQIEVLKDIKGGQQDVLGSVKANQEYIINNSEALRIMLDKHKEQKP